MVVDAAVQEGGGVDVAPGGDVGSAFGGQGAAQTEGAAAAGADAHRYRPFAARGAAVMDLPQGEGCHIVDEADVLRGCQPVPKPGVKLVAQVDFIQGVVLVQPLQQADAFFVVERPGKCQPQSAQHRRAACRGVQFPEHGGKMVQQGVPVLPRPGGKMPQGRQQGAAVHRGALQFGAAHVQTKQRCSHHNAFFRLDLSAPVYLTTEYM